jgi:hypothetical protein
MHEADDVTVPTACTLDATGARQRVKRWRILNESAHPTVHRLAPDSMEIRYPNSSAVLAELSSLAALEAVCCPFLSFAVHAEVRDAVRSIRSAPGAADDVAASLTTLTSLFSDPVV